MPISNQVSIIRNNSSNIVKPSLVIASSSFNIARHSTVRHNYNNSTAKHHLTSSNMSQHSSMDPLVATLVDPPTLTLCAISKRLVITPCLLKLARSSSHQHRKAFRICSSM